MFMIHLPKNVKVGDTVDCRINSKPSKVTWRDHHTLVIDPNDARRILLVRPDGDLTCFMCTAADGSGVVVFEDEDGLAGSNSRRDGKEAMTERMFAPLKFADATDMCLSYLGRMTASIEARGLGIELDDIHVGKGLRAYDGWEGYRRSLAENAAAIVAQREPPRGGPWSAELVILSATAWPRPCSLIAMPDGRLILWEPDKVEGVRIREEVEHADAVWRLIREALARPVYPLFVFARERAAEIEAGYTLAGQLWVDDGEKKRGKPTTAQAEKVGEIVRLLIAELNAGRIPDDALLAGWAGGKGKPPNAVDWHDERIIAPWRKRALTSAVRISPSDDGVIRVDRDLMRQMGAPPTEH